MLMEVVLLGSTTFQCNPLGTFIEQLGIWRLDIVQNVLIPRILLIPPDQNVSILFVNNIYIENIRKAWHSKLYIKTWYSSSFWEVRQFFLSGFLGPNCFNSSSPKYPRGQNVSIPKLDTTAGHAVQSLLSGLLCQLPSTEEGSYWEYSSAWYQLNTLPKNLGRQGRGNYWYFLTSSSCCSYLPTALLWHFQR